MRYPRYIPMPYRQPVNIALILGLLVAIYFIGKKLKWWDQPTPGADTVGYDSNDKPVRANFNAENEAIALAELLSYSDFQFFVDEADKKDYRAFKQILGNLNNENRAIHNAWIKRFAGGQFSSGIKDTLRKQVEAEYVHAWRLDATKLKNDVLKRFDRLGL